MDTLKVLILKKRKLAIYLQEKELHLKAHKLRQTHVER